MLLVESRRGFSPGARRAYATVGAQAAPALENLHLVEEAHRAGLLGERRRLAGEIHDTLAQDFTSIVTNLEAAESALASRDAARTNVHLDRARAIAREGLTEARRLVRALKPRLLEDAALPDALARLAEGWSKASGVTVTCSTTGPVRPLPPEAESVLFRAAQEALTNVAKHAGAGRVAITLSYVGDRVVLDVLDDGSGFDPAGASGGKNLSRNAGDSVGSEGGFGLAGMRERVESLGGTLTVESAVGEGTTLAVELPVGERVGVSA
jgi:signal transduction histidine kinase